MPVMRSASELPTHLVDEVLVTAGHIGRATIRLALLLLLLGLAAVVAGCGYDAGAPTTAGDADGSAFGDVGADATPDGAAGDASTADATPDGAVEAAPIRRVATQNAGTSEFMTLIAESPRRAVCADWYDNNLCTLESEAALADRIAAARPDVLMLQEVWDQRRCERPDRPAAVDEAPYACSAGAGAQPERVLPADYDYACGDGYPDNCVAWRRAAFTPAATDGTPCAGRDCSAAMVSVAASCGRDGRLAFLRGTAADGPTVLVVVHTNAGIDGEDRSCRAAQLDALAAALADEPPGTAFFVAGDFNFDPARTTGEERDALGALLATLDLVRLEDDDATHRILAQDLDLVLVSARLADDRPPCHVAFADEAAAVPMFDHAFVLCE